MKRIQFSLYVLIVCFISLLSVSNTIEAKTPTRQAVHIMAAEYNFLYKNPSPVQGEEVARVRYGEAIQLLSAVPEYQGWYLVKLANGTTGHAYVDFISIYFPMKEQLLTIKPETAYIRFTPSATSRTKGYISQNNTVRVVGEYGDYYYIRIKDYKGNDLSGFINKSDTK